eukprot:TRINITY_DN511_c0_g2_i2.p1 TRINITY_DN511_c0_g2~~TRINITY_DN511_c0_g2_i2.p1  ORF type:complete len:179 (-),score=2.86 TRINITY_DN511_c0_g2_i2:632-1168(-)
MNDSRKETHENDARFWGFRIPGVALEEMLGRLREEEDAKAHSKLQVSPGTSFDQSEFDKEIRRGLKALSVDRRGKNGSNERDQSSCVDIDSLRGEKLSPIDLAFYLGSLSGLIIRSDMEIDTLRQNGGNFTTSNTKFLPSSCKRLTLLGPCGSLRNSSGGHVGADRPCIGTYPCKWVP